MTTIATADELKGLVAHVRATQRRWAAGAVDASEVGVATSMVFSAIDTLPPNTFFSHASLEGELAVSRALVERAYHALNAGPGSAGIGKALVLLKEALGA